MVADLGFAAFVERNRPRYASYAATRLPAEATPLTVVDATLVSAREHWGWILSQPCPAAEVWQELRIRVGQQALRVSSHDRVLAALYGQLPDGCADSVVLCRLLGLHTDEAAELMGTEPPTVETALAVARRSLPHLVAGRRV